MKGENTYWLPGLKPLLFQFNSRIKKKYSNEIKNLSQLSNTEKMKKFNLCHYYQSDCQNDESFRIGKMDRTLTNYYVYQNHEFRKSENLREIREETKFSSIVSYRESFANNTFIYSSGAQTICEENNVLSAEKEDEFYARSCSHYKMVSAKIEEHLKDENRIFFKMQEEFIERMKRKQIELENDGHLICDIKRILKKEITSFLSFFQEIIFYIYDLKNYKTPQLRYFFFTKDNMLNNLISILFDNSIFFDLIRKIYEGVSLQEDEQLTIKYNELTQYNLDPEFFEVSPKFCLNRKTEQYIKEFFPNLINLTIEEEDISHDRTFSEVTQIFRKEEFIPFSKSIKIFQKIEKKKSPTHKLKNIIKTLKVISMEIEEFYEKNNINLDNYNPCNNFGGDDLIAILIFIVYKARVERLYAQCELITDFLTNNFMNSVEGYYLTNLKAAVKYLIHFKYDITSKIDSQEIISK